MINKNRKSKSVTKECRSGTIIFDRVKINRFMGFALGIEARRVATKWSGVKSSSRSQTEKKMSEWMTTGSEMTPCT